MFYLVEIYWVKLSRESFTKKEIKNVSKGRSIRHVVLNKIN